MQMNRYSSVVYKSIMCFVVMAIVISTVIFCMNCISLIICIVLSRPSVICSWKY